VNQVLGETVSFLGIKDDEILHRPTKGLGQIPWGGNTATGEKVFQINPKSASQWQDVLNMEEVSQLECILKQQMQWLEYSFATDIKNCKIPMRVKLENFLREIRFNLKHI